MLTCGYCLLPCNDEAGVTIGTINVPLCNDKDITCFELVTVYGRPLADGRRAADYYSSPPEQLRIDYTCPPGTGCELSQNGPCAGHWPTDNSN